VHSSGTSNGSSSDPSPTVENQPWFTLTTAQRRAVSRDLTRAAHEFGVSVSLLKALTYTESRWRQDVVSVTGAIGVGQLLPSTATWLGQLMREPDLSPYVRKDNIRMSAFLLRWLLDHTHSRRAAIASYYQGLGAVLQTGVSNGGAQYASTVTYRRIWFF
jgi:soluble lytic murein transglycosylase-like protein